MGMKEKDKWFRRMLRARRTRARLHGTAECPRLSVHRSLRYISAQLINDDLGVTLASANDSQEKSGTKTERAGMVGQQLAEKAKLVGVTKVVFDRGSHKYHGRVKALADAVRAAGLEF